MEHVPLSWALYREVVHFLQLIIAVGSVITEPLGSAHSVRFARCMVSYATVTLTCLILLCSGLKLSKKVLGCHHKFSVHLGPSGSARPALVVSLSSGNPGVHS